MLEIEVPGEELWDNGKQEFLYRDPVILRLEHSLLSLSKWESKWRKPYLAEGKRYEKTPQQKLDYIRCMTTHPVSDQRVYERLTRQNMEAIQRYIDDPMTATTFSQAGRERTRNGQYMTAEVIYAAMASYNIPFSCDKWHLNRLLTLLQVCNEESKPKKKMPHSEQMAMQRRLNEQRQAKARARKG